MATADEYFPEIPTIRYEGRQSSNPLSFKEYNADEVILGRPMRDWCRFSVCFWHTFRGTGADPFGEPTLLRKWEENTHTVEGACRRVDAAFELFKKLGVVYYTFHDRDVAPEGSSLEETNQILEQVTDHMLKAHCRTGVKLLWGTANLFSHSRYMCGAATNPNFKVFARAAAQVKKAMEVTHKLGGENYVFWGGREGYQSLLNTRPRAELDQLAAFFHLAVKHKTEIGATFQLLIEPKPREPTKHQYDYDAQTVMSFLYHYKLEKDFKLNIEPNHTTLAGHEYEHDIVLAAEYGMLGSIDCNSGDPMLGWDTDQFLMDEKKATLVMKKVIEMGGMAPGGLNFDCKVRRESINPADIFIAHIAAMDTFARGLRNAAYILQDGTLDSMTAKRYSSWSSEPLARDILAGSGSFRDLESYVKEHGEAARESGQQELFEATLNQKMTLALLADEGLTRTHRGSKA